MLQTYPNPATDVVHLNMNSLVPQTATVEICTNVGHVIRKAEVQLNVGENTLDLDVQALPTQLYYITLRTNDGAMSTKFLKIKR